MFPVETSSSSSVWDSFSTCMIYRKREAFKKSRHEMSLSEFGVSWEFLLEFSDFFQRKSGPTGTLSAGVGVFHLPENGELHGAVMILSKEV